MTLKTPLSLPDITLILIDNVAHELSQKALEDSLELIEPAEVIIWTDNFNAKRISIPGAMYQSFTGKTIEAYNSCLWRSVPLCVHTSHMLVMQWDGWVINPRAWTKEFLSYDYIGAVWPWRRENRIGNGGFSLRSTKMLRSIIDEPDIKPGVQEDNSLCRKYISYFKSRGFKWPGEEIADKFSREHQWGAETNPSNLPFGFHDCRNWPQFLTPEQLRERIHMCDQNPYISQKQEYKYLRARSL